MLVRMVLDQDDPVGAFWEAHRAGDHVGLRTSGTHAAPRFVVRTTSSWVDSFPVFGDLTGIDATARLWIPGPFRATMNLFSAVHAVSVGASIAADPVGATHAALTPARLLDALEASVLKPGCHVIVAGDALRGSVRDQAIAAGLRVSHYYGASELSFVGWGSGEDDLRPFPGVDLEIRDDVIWCRSPLLAQGYLDPNDAGPFITDERGFATVGDLGRLEGGRLRVIGRGSEAVTTAGTTVIVAEVEEVLRGPAHGDVVVIGLPHERWGAVLVAVVTDPRDLDDLPGIGRQLLEPHQRPRRWCQIDHFPLTEMGKVDRQALVRWCSGDEDTSDPA